QPSAPRERPPPNAWDAHAHIFGPPDKFPYTAGRGYTPPDAPVERYVALLDHLGFTHGLLVQGNAHGFDNRVLLDALARYPRRLRGGAITDSRVQTLTLRDWHRLGMRGCGFISSRKSAVLATCAVSGWTSSRYFGLPCVSLAGSCKSSVTGG